MLSFLWSSSAWILGFHEGHASFLVFGSSRIPPPNSPSSYELPRTSPCGSFQGAVTEMNKYHLLNSVRSEPNSLYSIFVKVLVENYNDNND